MPSAWDWDSHAGRFGVGKALLEQARGWATQTGAKGLMLETATDNAKAQALYESLGWKRETDFYTYCLSV
jgi:ribosomal protein S18 acetylase RimI-like enzyme